MTSRRTSVVVALVVVVVAIAVGTRDLFAPRAREDSEQWATLGLIAGTPRPIGSAAHALVRDLVASAFSAAGYDVEVQQRVVDADRPDRPGIACVENIVARPKRPEGGAESNRAVVLVAHYDSVPTGPGAADDGAGVLALIETARALHAAKPPARFSNDIVFLITDGEEMGLYGAKAAVLEPEFVNRAGVVLNFEARGHRGPSVMFETFGPKQAWVDAMRHVRDPVGYSIAADVYARMPNDTDLSVFGRAGLVGMNFAFIDGLSHYHTPLDSPAELDLGSLQHHGQYANELARYFGTADLDRLTEATDDVVYFSLWRTFIVSWSARFAPSIAWGALALGLAVLVLRFVRRRTCLGSFTLDVLGVIAALVPAAALFALDRAGIAVVDRVFGAVALRYALDRIVLIVVLVAALACPWVSRFRDRGAVALVVGLMFAVAGVVAVREHAAGSVAAFVALPVFVVEAFRVLRPAPVLHERESALMLAPHGVVAAIVIGVIAPLAMMLPVALGPSGLWLPATLVVSTALLAQRAWAPIARAAPTTLTFALLASAVGLAAPIVGARYDAHWPQPTAPLVVSIDGEPSGWNATIDSDLEVDGQRELSLVIVPPPGTWQSTVDAYDASLAARPPVTLAKLDVRGHVRANLPAVRIAAPPAEGFRIDVRVPAGHAVELVLRGRIPTVGRVDSRVPARAPGTFARPNDPDGIDATRTYEF